MAKFFSFLKPGRNYIQFAGGSSSGSIFRIVKTKGNPIFPGLNLDKAISKIQNDEASRIALICRQALQSAVPIDTGELRENIVIDRTAADILVEITDDIHHSGMTNIQLAQLLDNVAYKRSQDSRNLGPFPSIGRGEPTANWIGNAQRNVQDNIK